jgi:hypothetical protein
MSADLLRLGDRLLQAFAHSDLAEIDALCADDIVLVGTEAAELWRDKAAVLETFGAGVYDLSVAWIGTPVVRGQAVVGDARYTTLDGATQDARVTMVFEDGRCVHGHYSVPESATG